MPSWDLGLELFRENVPWSKSFPIQRNLYGTLLDQIQIEREGTPINRSALKSCIEMLVELKYPKQNIAIAQRPSVYKQEFEPAFLSTSVDFYRAEAERTLERGDAGAYLSHVERRFVEEEDRVTVYLNSSTGKDLRLLLERYLLSDHLSTIVDMPGTGIVAMLDQAREADLQRLYLLFRRVTQGIPELKRGLKEYILARGAEISAAVSVADGAAPAAGARKPTATSASESAPAAAATAEGQAGEEEQARKKPRTSAAAATGAGAGGAAESASSQGAATALRWVEEVLQFKSKFDALLQAAFSGDAQLESAINEVSRKHVALA